MSAMNKGIQQVRKSIQQRKNKRIVRSTNQENQTNHAMKLPSMEEKHGFVSNIEPYSSNSSKLKKPSRLPGAIMKAMVSVSLFFAVAIVMESNHPILTTPKVWTSHALTNDFPFARVHAWYSETFGSPLGLEPTIPSSDNNDLFQLPVHGNVTEHFHSNGTGIYITPDASETVHAWEAGIVTFVGKKKDTNKTIVVQHADGSKTTYGNMSDTDVHIYQHVVQSQPIGSFEATEDDSPVFFSLEQDDSYVDPIQVIKVDDRP